MSRTTTLLDLELRLLVARYGKLRVSKALEAIEEDVDLTLLDTEIRTYKGKARRSKTKPRSRKTIEEMVQNSSPKSLNAELLIKKLAHAYENKEFLPKLREVKLLLQSRGVPVVKIRSRAAALPIVIRALAQYDLNELKAFDKKRKPVHVSDLGMIADQILGQGNDSTRSV